MSTILSQYATLIANSIQTNLYSNTNEYTQAIGSALKFQGTVPPAGVIPVPQPNANQYSDQSMFAPIAAFAPGLDVFDVFAIANWARNIGQEFGILSRPGQNQGDRLQNIAKGTTFLASQFLLASFNPGDLNVGGPLNQIYNPLSIALSAVPFLRTSTTVGSPNAGAALSADGNVYSQAQTAGAPDRLLLMRQGLYLKATNATDIAQLDIPKIGYLGDISVQGKTTLGATNVPLSIEGQVDQEGPFGFIAQSQFVQKNIYTPSSRYSDSPAYDLDRIEIDVDNANASPSTTRITGDQLKLQKLFRDATFPIGPNKVTIGDTQYSWIAQRLKSDGFYAAAATFPDDVSVKFANENDDGLVAEANAIADDQLYMPFTFQDLRDSTSQILYFRAFLKDGLEENFSPNWQSENYYGRVDEVPTYQSTVRSISVGFDVVAWSPPDLPLMWQKLHKLQSMVYPCYDQNGYLQAGPLIRMRIGDLICASNNNGLKKGLPGYLNSLDFSYDDGIWNLKEDFKVPRKASITLGFTVIHDGNPGIYPFSQRQPDGTVNPQDAKATFGTLEQPDILGSSTVFAGGIRGVMEGIQKKKANIL